MLQMIGEIADEIEMNVYVVGGFVRDLFLDKSNDDIGMNLLAGKIWKNIHRTFLIFSEFFCFLENFGGKIILI